MRLNSTTAPALAAVLVLLIGPALVAQTGWADDEKRRIVKKIHIDCDGDDCEESEHLQKLIEAHAGDGHVVAWSSGDGPHNFRLRAHLGGGFLGVLLAELTPELRAHFGVDEDAGVMISRVVDDSPAARAGLKVGDIITAVDGETVASGGRLARSIRSAEDGEAVLLEVWRDGAVQNISATIEERERQPLGLEHAFVLKCDDDAEDCSFARAHELGDHSHWHADVDCPGGGPCEVKVQCDEGGECDCTLNGEETDCSELPGFDD